jgi:23S rRNA (cytidine1920-2'-O)/16S rRNA (cytidine1409-2'-O)-methyltransferase
MGSIGGHVNLVGIATRRRLDAELVRRHLAASRAAARDLVATHRVMVNGAVADKAARLVDPADSVEIAGTPPRFVGRGGEKLAGALSAFAVDPRGWVCLDVGSSTGGFTDCLLQAGAARVVAVDVGRGQLHERLRADDRVEVHEQTDIRRFDPHGRQFDLVVVDVSFISLRLVLDAVAPLVADGGAVVALVKPQFEAGRVEAARGKGVITDAAVWRRVLGEVAAAAEARGFGVHDAMVSPVRGGDGNVEFLLHLVPGRASRVDATAATPDGQATVEP